MLLKPDYSHQPAAIEYLSKVTGKILAKAPTGTGKGYIIAGVARRRPRSLIITPSDDIGLPLASKFDLKNVWTYRKLLNRLRDGSLDPTQFDGILRDEAHHGVDNTNLLIDEFFPHAQYIIGFTATDYRGTAFETARLRQYYGRVYTMVTIADAVKRGIMAMPTFEVYPLHNDELVDLANGEFSVAQVDRMVKDKMSDLVNMVTQRFWDPVKQKFHRPTMLTFTSLDTCKAAAQAFSIPTEVVYSQTSFRREIFDRVLKCETLLIQIKVVGEGVDLPIRCLIDAAPTMSPPFWMQRLGRITRPTGAVCQSCGRISERGYLEGQICPYFDCAAKNTFVPEPPPTYICTNHNLLRHGYLLEGHVPAATFKDYSKKWGSRLIGTRAVSRLVGGIKGFEKFKPAEVPLSDGTFALGMVIDDPTGKGHQYAALIHPATDKMILARRDFQLDAEGRRDYTKRPRWRKVTDVPELTGYSSVPPSPLTENMVKWWKKDAHRVGLDSNAEVNAKAFQFLPILLNLGVRIKI